MKKILLLLPMLSIFILTGCYDYSDINDRAMVGGVAFDKEGDEYIVSVQVMYMKQTSSESPTGQIHPVTISGRGKSIRMALNNILLNEPRTLCFTQVQIVIVQEKIAKEGILSILDFFGRHYETREQFEILISKEPTAAELLKVETVLEPFPIYNILKRMQVTGKEHGATGSLKYDVFLSYLLKKNINPVLSGMTIEGDKSMANSEDNIKNIEPLSHLQLSGLGVFKSDKLLGWLDTSESIGYNFAVGKIKAGVIDFPCDDKGNYASVQINKSKTSMKIDLKGDKPKVKIEIAPAARVAEINCDLGATNTTILKKMKQMTNKEIEKLVKKAIDTTQNKFNSDILGFGQLAYQKDPKYWKKNKDKWDQIYPTIEYEVKVNSTLIREGVFGKTIFEVK